VVGLSADLPELPTCALITKPAGAPSATQRNPNSARDLTAQALSLPVTMLARAVASVSCPAGLITERAAAFSPTRPGTGGDPD